MSQKCQQESHAPQQTASSFDHCVGAGRETLFDHAVGTEQSRERDGKVQSLRRL